MSDSQAQAAGERLLEIAEERAVDGVAGLLTEDILEEGMNHASPIHFWFEHDDPTAAHEYRKIQARRLPRSIEIVGADGFGDLSTWTAFEAIPWSDETSGKSGGQRIRYIPVTVVKDNEIVRAQVIARARASINAAMRELSRLEGLSPIILFLEKAERALVEA